MLRRFSVFFFLLLVVLISFNGCSSDDPEKTVQGSISIDPNSMDFGNVSVGEFKDCKFTIKQTGENAVKIKEISINFGLNTQAGEFAVQSGWDNNEIELLQSDTHEITIRFKPDSCATKEGTLVIKHNGENSPASISLNGQSLPFDLLINSSSDILTWNTGDDTVTASNVSCGPYITSGMIYENTAYYTIGDWMGNTDGVLKVDMNSSTSTSFNSSSLVFQSHEGGNPLSMAIISPVKAYVVNGEMINNGYTSMWAVTEINPSTNPPTFVSLVGLPSPASGSWSPEGCAVFENKLFVACTGYDMGTYSYRTGAIFVLDTVNNTWIDTDPATLDVDPIETQTVNPRYLKMSPKGNLYAICSGDYFSEHISVEVFDPVTFESVAHLDLGQTGGVGIPTIDAQDRMYIPDPGYMDADGGQFYSIDTKTNTILRDATDKLIVPGNVVVGTYGTGAMSCTVRLSTNTMYFANYFDSKLYTVDLSQDTNAGALPVGASTEITNVAGASSLNTVLSYNSEITPKFADTVFSYDPATSFNDSDKALGAPQGYGTTAGSLDVVTVEFGKSLVLEVEDYNVVDGAGWDFVLFENAFVKMIDGKILGTQRWMEPAKVSVSTDGINWTAFPATENSSYANDDYRHWEGSWVGLAPVLTSSASGIRALDWSAGGDKFDLAEIGVSKARYIKIEGVLSTAISTDIDAMAFKNYQKR